MVTNKQVKEFWERNPVAAEAIDAEPGTPDFFEKFDTLREDDSCEPYEFSNKIHGYENSVGLKVLDIGCGNGYVLSQYAKHGAEVYGVDITNTALELTKKRFEYIDKSCELHLTDGFTLPFADNELDIVCSMGVLHHIEDPAPMIKEAYRVLRPGGKLILMLYYKWSWKYMVVLRLKHLMLPKYWRRTFQAVVDTNDGDNCPLARVYSKGEAIDLLIGFDDIKFRLNQLSWKQLFLMPGLGDLLGKILPSCSNSLPARFIGWNLYIEAYKPEKSFG